MVIPVDPRPRPPRRGGPTGLLAMLVVLALAVGVWLFAGRDPGTSTGPSGAPAGVVSTSGLPTVDLDGLPPGAAGVVAALDEGRQPATGSSFENAEGLLPRRAPRYYRAYPLAGSESEAVVAGDQGELYWTDDGGATFAAVVR